MALSGDLSEFHLQELLQILAMAKKTGTLSVEGDVTQGALRLDCGRLLDANAGRLRGEPAFFSLARNQRGSFVFLADDPAASSGPQTIHRSLPELLMDLSVSSSDVERGGEEA